MWEKQDTREDTAQTVAYTKANKSRRQATRIVKPNNGQRESQIIIKKGKKRWGEQRRGGQVYTVKWITGNEWAQL